MVAHLAAAHLASLTAQILISQILISLALGPSIGRLKHCREGGATRMTGRMLLHAAHDILERT